MDSLFEELVAIDSGTALKFFVDNLREAAGTERLRDDETLYVASILAHYAQTSRAVGTMSVGTTRLGSRCMRGQANTQET